MKEISEEKFQISASVKKSTVKFIQDLAKEKIWHFSQTVDFLLEEAKNNRQSMKISDAKKQNN